MRQTIYRIYTEDSELLGTTAINIVGRHFESFTVIRGQGYWKGQVESTLIVEIISDPDDINKVARVAEYIRVKNKQEAVLVTSVDAYTVLISKHYD